MTSALIDELTDLSWATTHYGPRPGAAQLAVYADDLSDLDEGVVIEAIRRLRRTSREWPSVAEIREGAVAGQPLDGLAELAWREVEEQALRVGFNPMRVWRDGKFEEPAKPEFSSAITAEAVKSIGWRNICLTDEPSERSFLRNQFIKTWNAYSSRTLKQAQNGEVDAMTALGDRAPVSLTSNVG